MNSPLNTESWVPNNYSLDFDRLENKFNKKISFEIELFGSWYNILQYEIRNNE